MHVLAYRSVSRCDTMFRTCLAIRTGSVAKESLYQGTRQAKATRLYKFATSRGTRTVFPAVLPSWILGWVLRSRHNAIVASAQRVAVDDLLVLFGMALPERGHALPDRLVGWDRE